MEFLVTMTTRVPDGTAQESVDEVRAREAARSAELAAQGHLTRLWRPPLAPGEWRTLGLFSAAGAAELEKVLASMPLRVWRSDAVVPLTSHPNDPAPGGPSFAAPGGAAGGAEFFTYFMSAIPADAPAALVAERRAGERARVFELHGQGHFLRLWRLPPEDGRALGLWRAHDLAEVVTLLRTLPLDPWLRVETVPLTRHPNDPAPDPAS